jgi:LytS/YehU family sensor histidine kinase
MKLKAKYSGIFEAFIHVCFWIGFFTLPELLPKPQHMPFRPPFPGEFHPFFQPLIITLVLQVGYFYLNYYIFFKLFKTRRYLSFVLVNLAAISVIFVIRCVYDRHESFDMMIFRELSPFLFFFLAGTSLQIIKDQLKMQSELLENEVTFLRNQISPHFVFNVLNMINSFARNRPELIEPTVDKLSNLIRYMLYNTNHQTPLSEEVEHLRNYIELQKTRFCDSVKIVDEIDEALPNCTIEPMLLIPLVENAFKHGTALIDSPEIHISLLCSPAAVVLKIQNRFNPEFEENTNTYAGIGLKNIIRRLELLYPNSHVIKHYAEEDWYTIQLTICL